MSIKPIIIVPGEIKSIFFEIFFKSLKIKRYKSPLILICNYGHLNSQKKKCQRKKSTRLSSLTVSPILAHNLRLEASTSVGGHDHTPSSRRRTALRRKKYSTAATRARGIYL